MAIINQTKVKKLKMKFNFLKFLKFTVKICRKTQETNNFDPILSSEIVLKSNSALLDRETDSADEYVFIYFEI